MFIQTKNGLSALACFSMNACAAAVVSSSMVSMRLVVSAPVSSILPSAKLWITPRGVLALRNSASSFGQYGRSGSSSALRWYRLPKNSSKPWLVGRYSSLSPKWFLPNWPVA
ncbi:hypothetical protein D3C71_1745330 [compost metagenome]